MVPLLPGTEPVTWCTQVYLPQKPMAASSGSNLNNKFLQGCDSIRLNQCHLPGRSHSTYPVGRYFCWPQEIKAFTIQKKHQGSKAAPQCWKHFLLQTLSCFLFYSSQATWSYSRMFNVFFFFLPLPDLENEIFEVFLTKNTQSLPPPYTFSVQTSQFSSRKGAPALRDWKWLRPFFI